MVIRFIILGNHRTFHNANIKNHSSKFTIFQRRYNKKLIKFLHFLSLERLNLKLIIIYLNELLGTATRLLSLRFETKEGEQRLV